MGSGFGVSGFRVLGAGFIIRQLYCKGKGVKGVGFRV